MFLMGFFLVGQVFAQSPNWLVVEKKMELNISASETWELIKDYNGMTKWHPSIAKSEIIDNVENAIGCVRKITFLNDLILYEKLLEYNPSKMILSYDIFKIENGKFPVSSYKATLQVEPVENNKSILIWKSRFKRYDISDHPDPDENDEKAVQVIEDVYDKAFINIKSYVENKKMIISQLNNYVQGTTVGNQSRVKEAFDKNGTIKFIREGEQIDLTIDNFLSQYVKDGAILDRTYKIDFVDLRQDVATAKITIDYKTHQFVDYLTLIKNLNKWNIVSKVFTRIDKPQ